MPKYIGHNIDNIAGSSSRTGPTWNSGVWSMSESSGEGYSVNSRRKTDKWAVARATRHGDPIQSPISTAVLVLSGGGAGGTGAYYMGGAGGGGMSDRTGHVLEAYIAYTVTVGAGAALNTSGQNPVLGPAGKGGASQFGAGTPLSISTIGGGGSYSQGDPAGGGRPGGSGGGQPGYPGSTFGDGTGTGPSSGGPGNPRQGYPGGTGSGYGGGAGGGAGGVGGNGSGNGLGGNGGIGRRWPSPAPAPNPSSTLYAGGGGGGNGQGDPGSYGQAGPGGGGKGAGGGGGPGPSTQPQASMHGTANLGGGGGGRSNPGLTGGTGGSGVVVITYPTALSPAEGPVSGGTITTVGSETFHTFTTSGIFQIG
jgi:hypothetical protein